MSGSSLLSHPVVLVPIYNDLESCSLLLDSLDQLKVGTVSSILIVDDGSDQCSPSEFSALVSAGRIPRTVLRLRRNVGHQRAIAIGLCWLHDHDPRADGVVVMDGDGEDLPVDLPRLIAALPRTDRASVVFAERRRRSEGFLFRVFYHTYRYLHHLLTGIPVRFGNYSLLNRCALERLVVASELWNHYAAAVVKARVPYLTIPTTRGRRLAGETRMNFTALVIHGLTALSVFAEVISVRVLMALSLLLMVGLGVGAVLLGIWWNSGAGGLMSPVLLLLLLILQAGAIGLGLFFGVSALRSGAGIIPLRDYSLFVLEALQPDSKLAPPASGSNHD